MCDGTTLRLEIYAENIEERLLTEAKGDLITPLCVIDAQFGAELVKFGGGIFC